MMTKLTALLLDADFPSPSTGDWGSGAGFYIYLGAALLAAAAAAIILAVVISRNKKKSRQAAESSDQSGSPQA